MSTQPTPNPTPSPAPTDSDPVIELIRTQRQNVGYALSALAAAFLVVGVMLVVRSNKIGATPSTKTETKDGKDADDPFSKLPTDASEVIQPNRFDYVVGAFGMALGLVVTGGGAAFLIVGLPKPTEAEQRREARVLVLAVGGLLGAFLILMGAWFFMRWSDSLVKWLDKGEMKEAKYALYPLLMVVLGGFLMMLAIQPARAEERNNTLIRRLVYGSNFGLTVLILFVVLIITNAVVAMRVPNKLDTTSTGFYSLNPQTKQMLEGLDQPIHAYGIFQDTGEEVVVDTKRLLESARDANPSKFQVRFLSPALNKDEINKLRADYPLAEMSREGVLLVAGDEGGSERKRHSFIRADEFGEQKEQDGRTVAVFTGEQKLLRELMFLAENKQRPKIYFTQSSGELALAAAGGRPDPRRSAGAVKSYLEKNYFDVAPLTFDVGTPAEVPKDASVVVVADPGIPLPPNAVEALRKFMTDPRPDGKKGKLIVLAGGAQRGADERPLKLGIEPMLGTFGVQLSDRFLYARPTERADPRDRDQGTRVTLAVLNPEGIEARNPVALAFASGVERLPLLDCRELSVTRSPNFQTTTLLSSLRGRVTWTEEFYQPSPVKTWIEFEEQIQRVIQSDAKAELKQKQIDDLVAQKRIDNRSRDLAVFVSEGSTARVAVFGCGWFISDDVTGRSQSGATPIWFDLLGATLDWIRDRPPLPPLGEKQYTNYTLKPGYDTPRLVYVPLGIGLLIVLGLGAGVWVVRRK